VTDSVLSALLPQLNAPFDRTLLLVIADRADEVCGDGEGWRVLHQLGRQPTKYHDVVYWSTNEVLLKDCYRLTPRWLELVRKRRDVKKYETGEGVGSIADFSSPALAYQVAAEEWLKLNRKQKQKALEELK